MLDCDGWEYATAYQDAFTATVLGHAMVLTPVEDGLFSLQTEHSNGWAARVRVEAFNVAPERRANVVLALCELAYQAAGSAA